MPPKKRNRVAKNEGTVYYLTPVDHMLTGSQAQVPPNPNPNSQYNPLTQSLNKYPNPPQFQQFIQENGIQSILNAGESLGDIDTNGSNVAYILDNMKSSNTNSHIDTNNENQHSSQQSPNSKTVQRVFISRTIPEKYSRVKTLVSCERSNEFIPEDDKITTPGSPLEPLDFKLEPYHLESSSNEITFSNSNNKEKRRAELFGYYGYPYHYKEQNRKKLYSKQQHNIESRLSKLSIPRDPNTEISTSQNIDSDLFDLEQDIVEKRDYELTRLKAWRGVKRNDNLKTYYLESMKVYEDANELLINKLERLKVFFQRQKSLLTNLDRDFSEIGSARAEKFYSGFLTYDNNQQESSNDIEISNGGQQIQDNNVNTTEQSASETDTGGSSSTATGGKVKTINRVRKVPHTVRTSTNRGQILTSILEGFAPLLTEAEFSVVTGDELQSRYSFNVSNAQSDKRNGDNLSDLDGTSSATTSKKRSSGRPPAKSLEQVSSTRENTASLNKIMKQYLPPDELKLNEVEEDLEFLKSFK